MYLYISLPLQEMIVVHAESSLWNSVQGLCGTLDGNIYNDLLSDGLHGTLQYFSNRGQLCCGRICTGPV